MGNGGTLLMAGGALRDDNERVWGRFAELAGGSAARIAVLAAASARPGFQLEKLRGALAGFGVDPARVELLPVDPADAELARGAWVPGCSTPLDGATALWMTGGDQNRLYASLVDPDGAESPLLKAIRAFLDGGGLVGGTSAGCAVMSDPMIGEGTSFGALAGPCLRDKASWEAEGDARDALLLTRGFGFFSPGLVDQHFDARGRLGRLAMAALEAARATGTPPECFGVAENSALLRDASAGRVTALGPGGAAVVDVSRAELAWIDGRARVTGIELGWLSDGDSADLSTGAVEPAGKAPIEGDEALAQRAPVASGPLSAHADLRDFVARSLLDNAPDGLERAPDGSRQARGWLLGNPSPSGVVEGWEILFRKRPGRTRAWFGDDRYAFESVAVDLVPVTMRIESRG